MIPVASSNPSTSLNDPNRKEPRAVLVIEGSGEKNPVTDLERSYAPNLAIMYRQMVGGAKSKVLFFGSPYRAGDDPHPGAGSIEWISFKPEFFENGDHMEDFYVSGRDAMFYGHHPNVDRMWDVWTETLHNANFSDPDWLDASFYFYNENKDLVRVRVRDSLDTSKLGYGHETVDLPWLDFKPKPSKSLVNAEMSVFGQQQKAARTSKTLTPPEFISISLGESDKR